MRNLLLTFFLLILSAPQLKAQTDFFWPLSSGQNVGESLHFKGKEPQIDTVHGGYEYGKTAMCDSSGFLLFYNAWDTVYNKNHEIMENGADVITTGNHLISNNVTSIPGKTNRYYIFCSWLFDSVLNNSVGLRYSVVDMYANDGLGKIVKEEKNVLIDSQYYQALTAVPRSEGGYWLIGRVSDTFMAYPVTEAGIGKPVKTEMHEIFADYEKKQPTYDKPDKLRRYLYHLFPSASGNKIIALSCFYEDTTLADLGFYVYIYDFDRVSGRFLKQKLVGKAKKDNNYFKYPQWEFAAFSPDENLFYLGAATHLRQYRTDAASLDDYTFAIQTPYEQRFRMHGMKAGPDGNIYIHKSGRGPLESQGYKYYSIWRISQPDIPGAGCGLDTSFIQYTRFIVPHVSYRFPNTLHHVYRAAFDLLPDCGGIMLTDRSDTLLQTYNWQVYDSTGALLRTYAGLQEYFIPPGYGRYRVLLQAGMHNGFYLEKEKWITWAPPPTAVISPFKNTVCRYSKVAFRDSSATDTIGQQSWLWAFGDGSTSTLRHPTHSYTDTGVYTISLIYSNGFCSDTLVLPGAVTVNDAPKPGLAATPQKGCLPFITTVNDLSVGRVNRYLYDFGDGTLDSSSSQPSHTYTAPGSYLIRQYLYVDGGCITEDSFTVRVLPGAKDAPAPAVTGVSVIAPNTLHVTWQSNPVAAHYRLLRKDARGSATVVEPVMDTTYTDTRVLTDSFSYTYQVQVTDSCGDAGEAGAPGSSILLTVDNQLNEYHDLIWTPYGFYAEPQGYSIEKSGDGLTFRTMTVAGAGAASYQAGLTFPADDGVVYYRVSAMDDSVRFHSNIVRAGIAPQYYIPNAFSPNGDGVNDTLRIAGIGMREVRVSIYDRWGSLVYASAGTEANWDGKFRNTTVPEGVYMYKLWMRGDDGTAFVRRGTVTVVK
ncbi:MAG: gliding motility-associated C-terminal domain-containing protein [Bacteroidota bacterium]|nr:gliding motility-associated C-terminal domain-containing protein [Bacteroidota bacterium]